GDLGPLLGIHACVIGARLKAGRGEGVGGLLGSLARRYVHDASAARHALLPKCDGERLLRERYRLLRTADMIDGEVQVRPREAPQDDLRVLGSEAELVGDLVTARGRGRRRAGEDPAGLRRRDEAADAEVVWSEVVPPLHDAVRLVDRDHRELARLERVQESVE